MIAVSSVSSYGTNFSCISRCRCSAAYNLELPLKAAVCAKLALLELSSWLHGGYWLVG